MDSGMLNDGYVLNWKDEAEAVISDISFGVKSICISSLLPATDHNVYLNIETFEGQKYCVEMSRSGFKIVSDNFDSVQEGYGDQSHYETSYALLNKYSAMFVQKFGEEIEDRLKDLHDE